MFIDMFFKRIGFLYILLGMFSNVQAQHLAFPEAEGYGKYTVGGRGGKVIKVTNLNDSGKGSFREAVEQSGARIVVFDVDGTIELKTPLRINHDSITIAGQTAPGDGICLKDNPLIVNANEVIIRYIRVRVGDKYKTDADGIGGGRYGQHHVILDHLTSSWSIDECLSIYKTKNLTVQWCMINQSLTCSVHTKGCHGFGGIWGGYKATFHHNLLANHSSRNPRFSSVDSTKMVDFRNNVVFNWGFKAAYGGGRYGEINMVANYYKPGPGTQCPYKLLDVAEDGTGKYYISGNILEGNVAVSQDNRKGVFGKDSLACLVSLPFAYETIQEDTPQEAYRRVLEQAGCSLVRDNYDSEIVSQIKRGISLYGKNGFIDTPAQAGGWPELRKGTPLQDSDGDGMPDKWEKEHKLNPQDAGDASSFTICKYYTNIELYINGLVKY
ncbi:pectate lyase [Phocaeicola coprocola]|nr:pectate lyase [Phocaeicola coprocola]